MKIAKARLDADRTAKPLTKLVHHPRYRQSGGLIVPGSASHLHDPELIDEFGTRTPLVPPVGDPMSTSPVPFFDAIDDTDTRHGGVTFGEWHKQASKAMSDLRESQGESRPYGALHAYYTQEDGGEADDVLNVPVMAWRRGETPAAYAQARAKFLAFGDTGEGLSDTTKMFAVGGALVGAAALAWWLWPKKS